VQVCKLLLNKGADVNHKNDVCNLLCYNLLFVIYYSNYCILKIGSTPLIIASEKGHVQVCELLLKSGANINHTDNVYDILYCYVAYMHII
jgi:ankyrin repeat protein